MRARIYILENSGKDEKVILSTDEITKVNVSALPSEELSANVVSEVKVTIEGKILSKLSKNSLENLKVTQDLKEYGEKEFELSTIWEESKYEISIKTKKLLKEKYGHINVENISLENIYELNQENILGLKKWGFSYDNESDYRDVVIEFIYDNSEVALYVLPSLYAYFYNEDYSIAEGNGTFKIELRQKIGKDKDNEFIQ